MKLSETAREVIALATAIRSYWDVELPKRHRHYPIVSPGEDSGPPPPEKTKLGELLAHLPEDLVYQLVLLMYLGRGDFGTDDLATHYETLKAEFAKPDRAAFQMLEKAPLAAYLSDGLAELNKNNIDVDHLPFTTVNAQA